MGVKFLQNLDSIDYIYLFLQIYLFIFGCVVSSLMHAGFL